VLIVNIAGQILVLDNREASVRPAADFSHFRPLMAMNENWWELADQRLRQPVSASAPTANLSAPPPRPAHRPALRAAALQTAAVSSPGHNWMLRPLDANDSGAGGSAPLFGRGSERL
jgi:hypothetical protein